MIQWIREKYGFEMTSQQVSQIKAHDKRRGTGGNSADTLAAMETIKPLVLSHGIEKVRRMIDLCV